MNEVYAAPQYKSFDGTGRMQSQRSSWHIVRRMRGSTVERNVAWFGGPGMRRLRSDDAHRLRPFFSLHDGRDRENRAANTWALLMFKIDLAHGEFIDHINIDLP